MRRELVARPDAIRRHNLALVLDHIHRDGELTRAQLTERLQLSRSTVGSLVADLTSLGLLAERVPNGGARAGRPSHVVGPRPDGPYVVAVDVDVTRLTAAAVGIGGHVLARRVCQIRPSPGTTSAVAELILTAIHDLCDGVPGHELPVAVGVSVPASVGRRDALVEFAPNLRWQNEPFRDVLAQRLPEGIPVSVGNDANLAVFAEHLRGCARDNDDVVFLMGRIGVGAGLIVNGSLLLGYEGHAGEMGHNVVDVNGPLCRCGKRGCVETYIGDSALLRHAGRRQKPTEAALTKLFADAHAGDEDVAAAIRTVAVDLGRAVATVVNVLNPERVILGGSLAGVFEFAGPQVAAAVAAYSINAVRQDVQLSVPELGDDSSMMGAAELAFAELLADPLATR
jgi:predicted NBD/HSP70 family sugar kinase